MAKQLKTIQCPRCGSTRKTETKPDHFRCDSCGTEYFLDNDEIDVNVRHSYDAPPVHSSSVPNNSLRKVLLGAGVGCGLLLLILWPMVLSLVFNPNSSGGGAAGRTKNYEYHVYANRPVVIDGKVWIACLAMRRSFDYNDRSEEFVWYFYDIDTDRIVGETLIEGISKYKYAEMRRFADGSCYLSINETLLFRLNPETMQFEDYIPHIREVNEAFRTGLASVKIADDSFEIMSNIGDEYVYYPIADRVYTSEEEYRAARWMNSLLPGARDSTIYWFTDDNKPRLMEITYKYNAGGPEFLELLQRRYAENRNEFRIVEYHDVAPGRRWFDAWIAYSGRDDLLVSVRATAAEDAPISIQKIDTRTGEVLWSTPVPPPPERLSPWTGHYLRESVRVGDRYILKYEGHNYWILAADGTLLKEIKNLNSR